MQQIEQEKDSLYYRLFYDYRYGLEGLQPIYTEEYINNVKKSPKFCRKFELKYLGLEGNVLSPIAIDRCIDLGERLARTAPLDNWDIQTKYIMSIDIGWGSSKTAIMVSRYVNGKIQFIYSREFERPLFADIINTIWDLRTKCGEDNLTNIMIDAANTELYTSLCNEFNQNRSQKYLEDAKKRCKQFNSHLADSLFICPIPFNSQGRNMLNHTHNE
jgi:hypothetical protein